MKSNRISDILDKGLSKEIVIFLTILGIVSIMFGIALMLLSFDIGFICSVAGIILVIAAHIIGIS